MFALKCKGCTTAITEGYISALNGQWHPQCFVCRVSCWKCCGQTNLFYSWLPHRIVRCGLIDCNEIDMKLKILFFNGAQKKTKTKQNKRIVALRWRVAHFTRSTPARFAANAWASDRTTKKRTANDEEGRQQISFNNLLSFVDTRWWKHTLPLSPTHRHTRTHRHARQRKPNQKWFVLVPKITRQKFFLTLSLFGTRTFCPCWLFLVALKKSIHTRPYFVCWLDTRIQVLPMCVCVYVYDGHFWTGNEHTTKEKRKQNDNGQLEAFLIASHCANKMVMMNDYLRLVR